MNRPRAPLPHIDILLRTYHFRIFHADADGRVANGDDRGHSSFTNRCSAATAAVAAVIATVPAVLVHCTIGCWARARTLAHAYAHAFHSIQHTEHKHSTRVREKRDLPSIG